MKNVNELIPEDGLRISLETLIEKEHERCLDSIERINKLCASDYDEEYADVVIAHYRRKLARLSVIYRRLFSKDIYS